VTVQAQQWWLPALPHFEPTHPLRQWLVRADRLPEGTAGYMAGLSDYFPGVGTPLPAAALTRDLIAGDAEGASWLSADPAWVQPDLTGARLLACGQWHLSMEDALALAAPLKPVFGDAGMLLEIGHPDRWHLRLPPGTPLPVFVAPEQALGEDLSQHLPSGVDGRRWRVLLNEVQVILHQHPLNAARRAQGLAPINSVWFWGGGSLPRRVKSSLGGVVSDDLLLQALARHADVTFRARTPETMAAVGSADLIDLQDLPSNEIAAAWWPTLQAILERAPVNLHFASGERWLRKPAHRWRFWRGAGR
jgi:hypothetical protein